MPLPMVATVDDIRSLVEYLKNKPTGALLAEVKAAVARTVLDARKIPAYISWGIIGKDDSRIKLAPRGWELARKQRSEPEIYTDILNEITPYRSVLEWAFHQGLEEITAVDIAAHWHEHHSAAIGTDSDAIIKSQAVSFCHVCEAANIGKLTIGRRGQATRLTINREELQKFIEAGPTTPPWSESQQREKVISTLDKMPQMASEPKNDEYRIPAPQAPEKLRIFISHGKNMEIVEQVKTVLDLSDIESEIAVAEETTAIPVPEKVFGAMRRCQAGIIIVSVQEDRTDNEGNFAINENVLIEVGAAFVLYDKRVVLVWDKRLPIPSNLQGLYRCEFEGHELGWGSGMKLLKAIQQFKK